MLEASAFLICGIWSVISPSHFPARQQLALSSIMEQPQTSAELMAFSRIPLHTKESVAGRSAKKGYTAVLLQKCEYLLDTNITVHPDF